MQYRLHTPPPASYTNSTVQASYTPLNLLSPLISYLTYIIALILYVHAVYCTHLLSY